MNRDEIQTLPSLVSIVEAILFATDRPVTFEDLRSAIPEADEDSLLGALEELEQDYQHSPVRGVVLQEIAGGYQITTRPEVGIHVERFLVGKRRARLSRAALETLATIAYRQPVTRGDIEEIRGVDSGHVVQKLMERDLITVRGRSEALGRPLLYGTTTEFLRFFGISSLADLPNLEEFEALSTDDPLDDPEIREALENEGLWNADEAEERDEAVTVASELDDDETAPGGPLGEALTDSDDEFVTDTVYVHESAEIAEAVAAGNGHGDTESPANGNGHAGNGNGDAHAAGNGHAGNGNGDAHASSNGHAVGNGNGNGNGHAPANGNGNGNGDVHAAGNGNGSGNGHSPSNGNGHRKTNGNGNGDETVVESVHENEGGDERSEVETAPTGGFVPETAVSAELEPPSFGDEDDFQDGHEVGAGFEDEARGEIDTDAQGVQDDTEVGSEATARDEAEPTR
ncbi:MAG: SMC-Scp complex subunit ScpB [Candidatus Eisenbacteria bacterium]